MTREEAIECLNYQNETFFGGQSEALKIAIASLKTDEAYQLEYENRDFVEISEGMTNGDAIISLYPNLAYVIQNGRVVTTIGVTSSFDLEWWNAPYQKGE